MTKKGFGSPARQDIRFVAVELNIEEDGDVLDLVELHHLEIRKPVSKKDLCAIQVYSDAICGGYATISPVEFLAEVYVSSINDYALGIGANVARVYHNSCLGDNRIRPNSIGHIFEAGEAQLPKPVLNLMLKYVCVGHKVSGDKVSLRNRLGN